jgi:hypothetical protein
MERLLIAELELRAFRRDRLRKGSRTTTEAIGTAKISGALQLIKDAAEIFARIDNKPNPFLVEMDIDMQPEDCLYTCDTT